MSDIIPAFRFDSVGEMYTCGQAGINWVYGGELASGLAITITNNVAQPAPPVSSASSLSSFTIPSGTASIFPLTNSPRKRQYNGYDNAWLPNITETIASDINPQSSSFTWQSVNVTQGWYELQATFSSLPGTTYPSSTFFVQNGTNLDCLSSGSSSGSSPSGSSSVSLTSGTPSITSSSTSGSSATPSSVFDNSGGGANSSSRSHTGAIVGGVLGGLAFLVALVAAAALFFCRRRRVARYARRAQGGAPSSAKRTRRVTESMQALPGLAPGEPSPPQSVESFSGRPGAVMTNEKVSALEAPAEVVPTGFVASESDSPLSPSPSTDHGHSLPAPVFIPAPVMPMNRQPLSSGPGRRTSGSSRGSSGSSSEVYVMRERSKSQPDVSEAVLGGARTGTSPVPPVPSRRKPVPKYDSAEFTSAERASAERERVRPSGELHHQNSYGSMRAMHVLIPDLPPPPPRE